MSRTARGTMAGLLLLALTAATIAADPPAGTWKIALPTQQGTQVFWLVTLSEKDGQWSADVVTADGLPKSTLDGLRVTKDLVTFRLNVRGERIPFEMRPAGPDLMLGTAQLGGAARPLRFERTEQTKIDAYEFEKERVARGAIEPETVLLALKLLSEAEKKKATPMEVRSWADKAIKTAEAYGPSWRRVVLLDVAANLAQQEGFGPVAVQYARQAERMLDPAKDRPATQRRVLETLAAALKKAGKADDAKEVEDRVKKIDVSIKPTRYAGRKAKSDRAVLVELFTGAQCPPCVAADLAFDALGKAFNPGEVVLLQYHLHIPGPDPLTNADSEARAKFYDRSVRGTPTILFNGKVAGSAGGNIDAGPDKYDEFVEVIKPLLEKPAKAKLTLKAERKGNKIDLAAEVNDLEETGDDVRLRLVLVEEQVDYTGSNKLAHHHHVVRALPGGAEGMALKEKTGKKSVSIDLDELRKKLTAYLDKAAKEEEFPSKDRPLELKKLKAIAFVQNDETGEVLQAAQVAIKEE